MVFTGLVGRLRHDLPLQLSGQTVVAPPAEDNSEPAARSAIAANERAAKTGNQARQTNLADVSLETSLARRNIGSAEKLVLISRLSRFKDMELDVLVDSGGELALATMICEALKAAGWNVRIWQTSAVGFVRGLLVQTRRGADQTVQDPGVKLMLALQEVG